MIPSSLVFIGEPSGLSLRLLDGYSMYAGQGSSATSSKAPSEWSGRTLVVPGQPWVLGCHYQWVLPTPSKSPGRVLTSYQVGMIIAGEHVCYGHAGCALADTSVYPGYHLVSALEQLGILWRIVLTITAIASVAAKDMLEIKKILNQAKFWDKQLNITLYTPESEAKNYTVDASDISEEVYDMPNMMPDSLSRRGW